MGYLRKGTVINALREDKQDTKMCYEGCAEKEIVEFCYNCAEHAIDRLPQYFPENVAEESRWIPCTERLPKEEEYILLSFENYTVWILDGMKKTGRTISSIREMKRKPMQVMD